MPSTNSASATQKAPACRKTTLGQFPRFRKAADQGNTTAQRALGQAYAEGRGVPQDQAESVRWFRKAADEEQRQQRLKEHRLHQRFQEAIGQGTGAVTEIKVKL